MVKYHSNGIIAQLVEHMPYKHGVIGSSPIGSTKQPKAFDLLWAVFLFNNILILKNTSGCGIGVF